MRKIEFFELTICQRTMHLFENIAQKHTWDDVLFCKAWLKSEIFERTINYDQTLFCQDETYYYDEIMAEFGNNLTETGNPMYFPALGWFGYLTMYWAFILETKPEEFLLYNIKAILQDYPVLHTYSIEHAIEEIQENYTLSNLETITS